jgi:hypothetical protein
MLGGFFVLRATASEAASRLGPAQDTVDSARPPKWNFKKITTRKSRAKSVGQLVDRAAK